jgi:hypothetical protein
MKRATVLAVLLASSACGGSVVRVVQVPGLPGPVPIEQSNAAQIEGLTKLAATDLGCGAITLDRYGTSGVIRASGCSKHKLYVRLRRSEQRTTGGFKMGSPAIGGGDVQVVSPNVHVLVTIDFVDVAAAEAHGMTPGTPIGQAIVELNAQGAKDLDCPRTEVVPTMKPIGLGAFVPVAEGCGARVTYVPGSFHAEEPFRFQLASRVNASDVGADLHPWDGS